MSGRGNSNRLGPGRPLGAEGAAPGHERLATESRKPPKSEDQPGSSELTEPNLAEKIKIDVASMPISTPHPHYPCMEIMDHSTEYDDIMESVSEGIDDTADEVLWRSSAEDKYFASAIVFLGSQRIAVSVHLFANERKNGEKDKYRVLLQALCDSGYGWDFYTIWNGIVTAVRSHSSKVRRFVPEPEEEPSKPLNQPSVSEQLRASQIPAQYSSASNPPLEELPELNQEDQAPPPPSASELGIDTMTNLLGAPYDNERCVGIDLVESSIDRTEIREAVQEPLFACIGADSSYAESRIRALSLVRKMVKDGLISGDSIPVNYLRKGRDHLYEESQQSENQTPSFKYMMREYAELALKVIAASSADKELIDSLEKAKEQ